MILRLEETGDLEEISKTDSLQNTKWISGSLYDDINDIFHLEADDESQEETDNVLMFLLTGEGGLKVCQLFETAKGGLVNSTKANLRILRCIDYLIWVILSLQQMD